MSEPARAWHFYQDEVPVLLQKLEAMRREQNP